MIVFIRVKFDHKDFEQAAWERNVVGLWYGSWLPADWDAIRGLEQQAQLEHLRGFCERDGLGWGNDQFPTPYLNTIKRFAEIPPEAWVFVSFENTLHKARLLDWELHHEAGLDQSHPDGGVETFKARRIKDKCSFPLNQLPDVFRLLPTTGRQQTVCAPRNFARLFALLSECSNCGEVRNRLKQLSQSNPAAWLDQLSDTEWESLCTDYLIFKMNFALAGLLVGRTLRGWDIVGGNPTTGQRIFAQCKKDPTITLVDECFVQELDGVPMGSKVFLFAFGGCDDERLRNRGVSIVTGKDMLEWVSTEQGRFVMGLFTG